MSGWLVLWGGLVAGFAVLAAVAWLAERWLPLDDWRRVPRPNWRCSRGGRDYW